VVSLHLLPFYNPFYNPFYSSTILNFAFFGTYDGDVLLIGNILKVGGFLVRTRAVNMGLLNLLKVSPEWKSLDPLLASDIMVPRKTCHTEYTQCFALDLINYISSKYVCIQCTGFLVGI